MFRFDPTSISIVAGDDRVDKSGKSVKNQLDREDAAICLPHTEEKQLPQIDEKEDLVGFQNPKNSIFSNTSYNDVELEAKAWPHLFPYGNGSYHYTSKISISEYVKYRLLNFDSRWRKDPHWAFFFFDRMVKQRILYANRMRKANPQNAKHLTVGDVSGIYNNSPKK